MGKYRNGPGGATAPTEITGIQVTRQRGMKSKPSLRIVSWCRPETTTITPPDDLNDAIPDLSK
jgi:hypothetical protein